MKVLRSLLLLCTLLPIGCYDSSFGENRGAGTPPPVTTTIGELRAKYNEVTEKVTSEVVVAGIVTTSDQSGNFYRTLCIENDGAAIEFMAGIDHLHNIYPIGCRVTLRLKGLAMGTSYGTLQAGRMPAAGSYYATDYLGSPAAVNAVIIRGGESLVKPDPTPFTISELHKSACGTLVRIDGLQYAPTESDDGTWAGYHSFSDDAGATIYTYTRAYARFAGRKIPIQRCSLTGILQLDASGGRFILKLRDEQDCAY